MNTIDIKFIEKLAEVLKKHKLGEIELKDAEQTIRIKSSIPSPRPTISHTFPPTDPIPKITENTTASSVTPPSSNAIPSHHKVIKAPLVGTIYLATAPGDPPFIEVGKKVNKGDTLFIVEAMKIMNKIESEHSGYVDKILVSNEQAVEFDQPLVIIR